MPIVPGRTSAVPPTAPPRRPRPVLPQPDVQPDAEQQPDVGQSDAEQPAAPVVDEED